MRCLLCLLSLSACTGTGTAVSDPSTLHPAFADFDPDNFAFFQSGDDVILDTNGLPNHATPYWGPDSDLYVEGDTDFRAAPGYIQEVPMTLRVPLAPELASAPSETNMGPIGMAVSGAVIYNGSEGQNQPLDEAAVSLDYTGAHTGPMSYHYHLEPVAWSEDDSALIGIMSDGFLLYGRRDTEGEHPDDLDASGGHTAVSPHGVEEYHYHIKNELYLGAYYLIFPGDYQGTPNAISM